MFSEKDSRFMAQALALAEQGAPTCPPNPAVGCVIVRDEQVIGRGFHQRAGEEHAEIVAMHAAGDISGSTVYVTLEPCAHQGRTGPCANALAAAKPARVIAAMEDPNPEVQGKGLQLLREAGIEVRSGLLENEARELNAGFIKRMLHGRPRVTLKVAASLDGRTALANGQSKWITSDAARHDVHRMRACMGAILTGSGTVQFDDPKMTARPPDMNVLRQPLRVVLDSERQLDGGHRIFNVDAHTILVSATGAADSASSPLPSHVETVEVSEGDSGVDLGEVLDILGQREINEVLVEAGSTLNGAMIRAGLVDRLIFYMAPCLMGDRSKGMFALGELQDLAESFRFRVVASSMIGPDLKVVFEPEKD